MANTLNNLNYQQINLFDLRMNDVIFLLLEAEVLDGVNTNAGNPYSEIVTPCTKYKPSRYCKVQISLN